MSARAAPANRWALLAPQHWPTWIALGVMRLLCYLPFPVLLWMGRGLGTLLSRVPISFVRIARRNLDLCFPEMTVQARKHLLHDHIRSVVIGMFETAMSWWGPPSRMRRLTRLEGEEHLDAALKLGKGAILLSGHFTTLEVGAYALCLRMSVNIMYRPTSDPVLENFLMFHRGRRTKRAIRRDDIRSLITALKDNEPVWYAPDQSYRKKGAQMVPFFGIPAATNTATSRLARMTGAAVLPYFPERLPGSQGYRMVILPMLDNFPSDDPAADAERFNKLLEAHIRRVPDQYLWIHRRFKGLTPDYPNYYRRMKKAD